MPRKQRVSQDLTLKPKTPQPKPVHILNNTEAYKKTKSQKNIRKLQKKQSPKRPPKHEPLNNPLPRNLTPSRNKERDLKRIPVRNRKTKTLEEASKGILNPKALGLKP